MATDIFLTIAFFLFSSISLMLVPSITEGLFRLPGHLAIQKGYIDDLEKHAEFLKELAEKTGAYLEGLERFTDGEVGK